MMYLIACIGLFILTATFIGMRWSRQEFSPHRYGVKPIVLADGQRLYLKREVGLHYDRTALSLNSDRCIGPNDATDYVFSSLGAGELPLYYQTGKNDVVVYDSHLNLPGRTNWMITIRQERLLGQPHFGGRKEDYTSRGISRIEIPLSELSACGRN